uniref:Secreted protein n=1 Tax=Plectus sambesii TaxID=2011161 RepID=A0A914VX93_9BILA
MKLAGSRSLLRLVALSRARASRRSAIVARCVRAYCFVVLGGFFVRGRQGEEGGGIGRGPSGPISPGVANPNQDRPLPKSKCAYRTMSIYLIEKRSNGRTGEGGVDNALILLGTTEARASVGRGPQIELCRHTRSVTPRACPIPCGRR